ncbi:TniQ family protein [Gordonia sputi]|uniref:TniQ domain-containing protein n=1 Tax=Gordonia sputi NBRC 100414 TaxID=1089453 RepID=H5TVN8_9ACTN|nr:TniQ family protein [Gordonia sputi]NKY95970.1 TniQ family protein [Gordonia sputi]GAB37546.1 hypothetical protein GOSPT_014_00100 [Gordonia sputi NBRC 100414]
MTRRLPITSAPLPNETLDSWVNYVAALIAPCARDMFDLIGLPKPWPTGTLARGVDPSVLAGLAQATGSAPEVLRRATLQAFDGVAPIQRRTSIDSVLLTGRRVRFCPECVAADNRAWQLDWLLSVTHVCSRHQRVLTEAATPNLVEAASAQHVARVSHRVIVAQQWIERVIRGEIDALARNRSGDLDCEPLLHDIAMLIGSSAKKISFDSQSSTVRLFGRAQAQATAIVNECWVIDKPQSMPPMWERVVAMTLITEALTVDDVETALSLIAQVPVGTAQRFANSRPPSDVQRRLRSRPVRELFLTHIVRTGSPTAHIWRSPALVTAPGDPVPMRDLPGRVWAPILQTPPPCTDRARPILPTTLILSLAGVGFIGDTVTFKRYFRWTVSVDVMQNHMSALFDHPSGDDTLNYVMALRDHLLTHPSPIDYHRRRTAFRTHHCLLPRNRRVSILEQMSSRYVWQLLTGGDPFLSAGTGTSFGLLAARYAEFVELMDLTQRQTLAREALSILRAHAITDEPLMYTPAFGSHAYAELATLESTDDDPARFLLAGSYITEVHIDSTIPIDELIARAMGDVKDLERSIAFIAQCATSALGGGAIDHEELRRAAAPVEQLLGRTVYVRRSNGRFTRFNRTGEKLVEAARAAGMI